MRMFKPLRPRGFTLIELLVVMAIIATLLSIAAPRYFDHLDRARENSLRQTLAVMRDAIDKYTADVGRPPETLDELVDKRYLRSIPEDPVTESVATWVVEPPPDDPLGGIWNIRSGAGEPYGAW